MIRSFMPLVSIGILGSAFITTLSAADNTPVKDDAKPPRYKLHVGQELNYEGQSEFKYENGALHSKSTWKLTVVRQNTDGGWRLLVRHGSAHGQTSKNNDQVRFNPERVSLAWCDLTPDGRITDNPTLGYSVDVRPILPLLPPTAAAATWQCENALTGVRLEYTATEQDSGVAGHLKFLADSKSPSDEIYLSTNKSSFSFDVKRGLIDRVETETTQGYGFDGRGTGLTTLAGVERVDPNLATAMALEMNDYFAVKAEYDELLAKAGKDAPRTAELLARALANLKDLRQVVTTKVIQNQLDEDIAGHARMEKYTEDEAKRLAAVLGQPSATWETTDLAGSTRSIEGCRGKVVILDFWYRGCGWCIRAMPQVKQVAAHYQGRPVEVFGMNTDSDEADARFVVEKLGLAYPTLKAEGLPEKYGVRGFPTLVILDQAGVVRDVHVGYSPTLAKSVIASVDKLLAVTPAEK